MDRKKHMPILGVGPLYVGVIFVLTVFGIYIDKLESLSFGSICIPWFPKEYE